MRLKERVYVSASRVLPSSYRQHLSQMLLYTGEGQSVDYWLGSGTVLGLLVLIIALIAPFALQTAPITGFSVAEAAEVEEARVVPPGAGFLAGGALLFIIIQLIIYLVVYFKVEDRTRRAEKALPDALHLMAANIRAGMTPFQAMKLSARKEFGPLSEEIGYATAKALGTESFSDALLSIKQRIKSGMLDRVMQLFASSMKAGGHLAQLLEEVAKDISATRALKRELVTNTKMYTMLIMFTIVICAPLLQAISIHFVKVITDMQSKASAGDEGFGMSFLAGEVAMTPEFLIVISVVMLVTTSLLASMLAGVIVEGKGKYGLKYAPIVITGTLIMFFVFRHLITAFFGSMG
ncbi:MAG: type II secretion system F family protein [Nanoarchaeota archaeon]|nr:type II secretion system F family protein [Nanoarchaeota archaeon]